VIHGMHEEQDIRRMGALRKLMPITAATFIVGWLAIAGVPPLAGFWSKDEILLYAFNENPVLWVLGLATALLTAYYMSRQVFLVFFGDARWKDEPAREADAETEPTEHHPVPEPHESPWLMTLPLIVLAGLAAIGGAINLAIDNDLHFLEKWLEPVVGENEAVLTVATNTKLALAAIAVVAALAGIALAARVYLQKRTKAVEPQILADGWYYDRTITAFMGGPGRKGFEAVTAFDETVIDGAVNGVGATVRGSGRGIRVLQTGYVRSYALGVAIGAVGLLAFFLTRAGV